MFRYDRAIKETIEMATKKENELSGCCVRNDGSGCLQTTQNSCSPLLSTFFKVYSYYTLLVCNISYL